MPLFLALDVAALSITVLGSVSLVLMALGGSRSSLSVSFALYATAASGYAASSLLLRLALWFSVGNPQILLELASLGIALTGPLLLLFTARYTGRGLRWASIVSLAAILLIGAVTPFLFTGRVIADASLTPNGVTLFRLSRIGLLAAFFASIPMALPVPLLWSRGAAGEPFIAISASVSFAGFLAVGITGVMFPVLSYTGALSVGLLGYAVVRRQLFNPFRALSEQLAEKVAERRRAEESLRERARRLELIASIGQKTTSLLGRDELLAQAVTLVQDAFSYFSVGVLLIEGDYLVARASTLQEIKDQIGKFRVKVGAEGLTGHVAATGEPLLVNDVDTDHRYLRLASEVDTRSELDVPIRLGGKVIGVLDAQSTRRGSFTEMDLFTMQTIADQLAVAIENGRLYEQEVRRSERLALVGRISAAVSAVLNLPDLMETVYREVTPIFSADAFFIALYDEVRDELDFRIQVDEGTRERAQKQTVGSGLTSRVIRERRSLLVNDMSRELAGLPTPELWGTGKMPSSWLGVPMLVGERLIGVICVQTYGSRAYEEEDRGLLGTIADQVAVAVENARLYEALRLELVERQRTEKGLRESEEQFRNLAEQSPNMIFINTAGRVVYANRQCEVATGRTREEFYDSSFRFIDLVAPEHRDSLLRSFRRHSAGEEVAPYEYTLIARDGRRIDAIITTKLISYAGEQAILGIITDITTRKRTERLLRALNAAALAMEQVFTPQETLRGAVRELGQLGFSCVILLANEQRTHFAPRFASGRDGEATELPDGGGEAYRPYARDIPELAEVLRARKTILTRVDLERFTGGRTPATQEAAGAEASPAILAPLSVGEDVFGLLAVRGESLGQEDLQAISAFAHQTAAAWRKTTLMRDLGASLEELKTAQEQLLHAQKMQAIGRLAGGIAHDFNNVLTVISGFSALLGERLKDNQAALADVAEIRNAVRRASALTRRLLAFSRKQILQPQVLDLNTVVAGCAKLLGPIIGEDIEVAVRLGTSLGPVLADPYQIEQVIINLAVNARDAMPAGGKLFIETQNRSLSEEAAAPLDLVAGAHAVLTVRDTGVGMSEEVMSHLFEPFFTTKEDGKGTGLGLSTVYGIIKQTGGAVTAQSTRGLGSTFTILLPQTAAGRPPARAEAPARPAPGGTGTILLVEDDDLVRELTEKILCGAGYTVLAAASGEEALRTASGPRTIRLMIADVVMPGGMTGVELARRLGQSRPGMPVLFISGYTEERSIHLGVPKGLPFLAKPFQPNDLLSKVAELLR